MVELHYDFKNYLILAQISIVYYNIGSSFIIHLVHDTQINKDEHTQYSDSSFYFYGFYT